jgi:hypothetical protein
VLALSRTLHRAGVPGVGVVRGCGTAVHQTWLGIGRISTQFAAPALVAAILAPRPRGRRVAAASLLLGPPLTAWATRRPALDPVRFTTGYLADDVAYGLGVWAGSVRAGTSIPLRPAVSRGMVRIGDTATPT